MPGSHLEEDDSSPRSWAFFTSRPTGQFLLQSLVYHFGTNLLSRARSSSFFSFHVSVAKSLNSLVHICSTDYKSTSFAQNGNLKKKKCKCSPSDTQLKYPPPMELCCVLEYDSKLHPRLTWLNICQCLVCT